MRRFALIFLLALFSTAALAAALHFPELTGRVVDDAHVLSLQTIQELDQKLADYENGTTNQVVVVTLPSLQGDSIEDYGYQLGRYWGIGQKGKNNGALLIVAPNEHKVRIEVGYGLEPVLTDAASSEIVNSIIVPDFKKGDIERGVREGTDAILFVLGVKGEPSHDAQPVPLSPESVLIIFFLIILMFILSIRYPIFGNILWFIINIALSTSRTGSSGFSGGFSGGGGSFGGGGASGSW